MGGMQGMPPTVVRRPTRRTQFHIVRLSVEFYAALVQQRNVMLNYGFPLQCGQSNFLTLFNSLCDSLLCINAAHFKSQALERILKLYKFNDEKIAVQF